MNALGYDGYDLQLSSSHNFSEVRSDPLRWSTSRTSGGSTWGLGSMVPGLGFHGKCNGCLGRWTATPQSCRAPPGSASLRSKHFNKHEEVLLQYHKWSNDSAVMCSQLVWMDLDGLSRAKRLSGDEGSGRKSAFSSMYRIIGRWKLQQNRRKRCVMHRGQKGQVLGPECTVET